eukprot:14216460-Alexandrium_andersonii.AAC.1
MHAGAHDCLTVHRVVEKVVVPRTKTFRLKCVQGLVSPPHGSCPGKTHRLRRLFILGGAPALRL